jgi:uncharacterized membrane protein
MQFILNILLFLFSFIFSAGAFAQTLPTAGALKTIAIIPPLIKIERSAIRQDIDSASLAEIRKKEAFNNQLNTYYFLTGRNKKYGISIQNIVQTNELLEKAGVSYEGLYLVNQKELAQLLGVDLILSGVSYRVPDNTTPEGQLAINIAASALPLNNVLGYARTNGTSITTFHTPYTIAAVIA